MSEKLYADSALEEINRRFDLVIMAALAPETLTAEQLEEVERIHAATAKRHAEEAAYNEAHRCKHCDGAGWI